MNRRHHNCRRESGIALIITLIMLAVVTLMAIVFLALSRRERAQVIVAEDLATANYMAEAALERAKAQAVAQMAVAGSKLSYDLFVSTNFVSPTGFVPQGGNRIPNPTNVSYTYGNGSLVTGDDHLQLLANLQYDARPPVFVETNDNGDTDFRFYLDFNRNRRFETNGILAELDFNGNPITITNGVVLSNRFVGDLEWIGILERPEYPHSETNRFIGRMAYIALPAGKTLDLNHMHNQADPNADDDISTTRARNGYSRNQGYGSWEINLAAALRELNTNNYAWHPNSYVHNRQNPGEFPRGEAFDDARNLLSYRYGGNRRTLLTLSQVFSDPVQFSHDNIDNYGDGPFNITPDIGPNYDRPNWHWPGSLNTNAFYDVQELFGLRQYAPGFVNRLEQTMTNNRLSTYDRYTFSRMLSQIGVDSTPYIKGKIHLNYQNEIGEISTNMVPWTNALQFFMKAADVMIKTSIVKNVFPIVRGNKVTQLYTNYMIGDTVVRPDISITNIQLYHVPSANFPFATSNEYSASLHRILQVAANIYDSMTNRWNEQDSFPGKVACPLPTVFRPVFTKTATNVFVSGFIEVTNVNFLSRPEALWYDLSVFATNNSVRFGQYTNVNLEGQPWVIGAKKGHPNFNEVSVESVVQVTRKLELTKANPTAPVTDTNQLYLVSIENIWGMEAWNSYLQTYRRPITIHADISSFIALSNKFGFLTNGIRFSTNFTSVNITTNNWVGTAPDISQHKPGNFIVPIYTAQSLLSDHAFLTNSPYFVTNQTVFQDIHEPPQLDLYTTNRVRYWVFDAVSGHVLDFVNLDNLITRVNLAGLLSATNTAATDQFAAQVNMTEQMLWDSRPLNGPGSVTAGITNQIAVSIGDPQVYANIWRPYTARLDDKKYAIDVFRKFLGLPLLFYQENQIGNPGVRRQAPFTPSRKQYVRFSWAANDPLVHYTRVDLQPQRAQTNSLTVNSPIPIDPATGFTGNLGRLNERYNPWGGGLNDPTGTNAFRLAIKDPGIRRSDDWLFPINLASSNYFRFPSIGWLGRVHRGTPWQTIYLKSFPENYRVWFDWAGSVGTHPTTDRRLLDVFTVAPNEAAASGLLSVNQTNRAAWSAVLSGLPVTTIINSGPISRDNPPQYREDFIAPASAHLQTIVDNINRFRAVSSVQTNWIWNAGSGSYVGQLVTNGVFEAMGDILGSPALSDYSPFLWQVTNNLANPQARIANHNQWAWTDDIVERIPTQILSLLQRDDPRFVVYAFGQSLKPAARSLATTADFYNLCTNYQITGEVITKTTFRVEGEVNDPGSPLRAVVESYKVLPPPE